MSKFDNFVFMTICELTLETYKETQFSTHSNYCRNMALNIKDNTLAGKQINHMSLIYNILFDIFSMDSKEASDYIVRYFYEEKFLQFEMVVRTTNEYFPNVQKFTNIKASR